MIIFATQKPDFTASNLSTKVKATLPTAARAERDRELGAELLEEEDKDFFEKCRPARVMRSGAPSP